MGIFSVENMNLIAEAKLTVNQGKSYIIGKEECLSFIEKQTYASYMQIMLANYINEVDGKNWTSQGFKRNKIQGVR